MEQGAHPSPKKPNFVVLYTDDQRWDAMGVVQREQNARARFPWLETPSMDRIAREGTRYRNAFVVNSLCAPSRASILTGQYGHVNGVVNNHTPFPVTNVTVATLLKGAGYRTGFFGKWHMGSQRERPGFDVAASFIGQGRYMDCPFVVNGRDTPTEGWVDDVSTEYALQFIKNSAEKPFFLMLGFKTAHQPFAAPPRAANAFATAEARGVPNLDSTPTFASNTAGGARRANNANRPYIRDYFRCIRAVDDCVGKILDAVDDNTVVIFASDNGFYLGEHGLGDKRTAYDESLRIPLIVRLPKSQRKQNVTDALALNIDIAPTLLEMAGVPVPRSMQGQSLVPTLRGGTPPNWRRSFYYTYFYEAGFSAPTTEAVRTETAKLVRYPDHPEWTQVFDLRADPYETRNLASDPKAAGLRKSLESEFDRQQAAIRFQIPPYADKPGSGRGGAPNGGMAAAPRNAWVLDWKDAQHFDGTRTIDIPRAPALAPNVGAWAVEATLTAEKPDGMILARGGVTNGYSLHLENGRPVFTVASDNRMSRIIGPDSIVGRSVVLLARITPEKHLTLVLDGKPVAEGPLADFISRDPNDSMQIGGDDKSPVTGVERPRFVGTITRVRLYSGDLKP